MKLYLEFVRLDVQILVNYNATADIVDDSLCEYPATCVRLIFIKLILQILVKGLFSFEMAAAGSANINVSPVTDFPEFIETTVYSDCDGLSSVDSLEAGTYFVNVVQMFRNYDVDFAISVDAIILGCTDVGAAIIMLWQL